MQKLNCYPPFPNMILWKYKKYTFVLKNKTVQKYYAILSGYLNSGRDIYIRDNSYWNEFKTEWIISTMD